MGRITRRSWLGHMGLATVSLSPLAGLVGCSEPIKANKEKTDALMALSPQGAVPPVIRIGITPSTGEDTGARLQPLVDYLERAFGVTAEGVTAEGYDHLAVLVQEQAVEIGIFSPLSYVKALEKKVEAVAIATATRNGSPTYLGYLVANREKHGERLPMLDEFRGKRVAWVNKSSTSGYLYPRAMLHERGIDPDVFFAEQRFAKNHKDALRMVRDGEADLAAAASSFVDPDAVQIADEPEGEVGEREGHSEFVVVAKTRHIPLDCVVVHKRLQRDLGMTLRKALEALVHDPVANEKLGQTWGLDGFVRPMHRGYQEIARVYQDAQQRAAKKTG